MLRQGKTDPTYYGDQVALSLNKEMFRRTLHSTPYHVYFKHHDHPLYTTPASTTYEGLFLLVPNVQRGDELGISVDKDGWADEQSDNIIFQEKTRKEWHNYVTHGSPFLFDVLAQDPKIKPDKIFEKDHEDTFLTKLADYNTVIETAFPEVAATSIPAVVDKDTAAIAFAEVVVFPHGDTLLHSVHFTITHDNNNNKVLLSGPLYDRSVSWKEVPHEVFLSTSKSRMSQLFLRHKDEWWPLIRGKKTEIETAHAAAMTWITTWKTVLDTAFDRWDVRGRKCTFNLESAPGSLDDMISTHQSRYDKRIKLLDQTTISSPNIRTDPFLGTSGYGIAMAALPTIIVLCVLFGGATILSIYDCFYTQKGEYRMV